MDDTLRSYFPPPKRLPFFPDAEPTRGMTPMGGGKTRKRWKDKKAKKIYEWDYQHGKVERWDWKGRKHEGEFDPDTGEQTKDANPSRPPIPMHMTKPMKKRKTTMNAAFYLYWYDKTTGEQVGDKLISGITESDVMKWYRLGQPEDTYGCLPLENAHDPKTIAKLTGVTLSSKYNYFIEWLEAPTKTAK